MASSPTDAATPPADGNDMFDLGKLKQDHLTQDDSIPFRAQRHLAIFLAAHSQPRIGTDELLDQISSSAYVNQKKKILNRTHITQNWKTHGQPRSGLLRLPPELLCAIKDYLDPSDLVCLALTCRNRFHMVNVQLVDLKNLAFAGDLWPILSEYGLDLTLAKERYKVMRRLHRDRLTILDIWCANSDWMPCSACTKLHPRRYFSFSEQRKPLLERKCLASTASIRICDHWSENLLSLRGRTETALCQRIQNDILRTEVCGHPDHEIEGFSAPQMRDIGGTYSVDRTIKLGQTHDRGLITEEAVRRRLQDGALPDVPICPHVYLGDECVVESFRKRSSSQVDDIPDAIMAALGYLPEFEASSCDACGRSWQFGIIDSWCCYSASPKYTLKLTVDEQMKPVRDPWDEAYLKKVENGEALIRLMY